MPKSKHRKDHKQRLNRYKADKKMEQEALKKKLMDEYIRMQQRALQEQEQHTSTEEVVCPQIDVDELNLVDESINEPDFEEINIEDSVISGDEK